MLANTNIEQFEEKIGYKFKDKELLKTALVHSSYAAEAGKNHISNNERLEFIGDGLLDAIIGVRLFNLLPDSREGTLSKDRANIVCEKSLAGIARDIGLGEFIMLGRGESNNGGRNKESILSDALEAVVGAIYIDGGFEAANGVVLNLFDKHIELAIEGKLYTDYKTVLQEKFQEEYKGCKLQYVLVSESGLPHDKVFETEIHFKDRVLGRGKGRSKKDSEQEAAKQVLLRGDI